MSCAAFTFLGVYVAATDRGNGWVVGGSALLALVFFTVAAYQTWKEEHDRFTSELAKNQKPDIRGEVVICGYGIEGEGYENETWSVNSDVVLQLSLCNHRAVRTTLQDIECDGSQLRPPVVFSPHLAYSTGTFPVGTEMPHGIGTIIDVSVPATIVGVRWKDVHPIDLKYSPIDRRPSAIQPLPNTPEPQAHPQPARRAEAVSSLLNVWCV
jgi:hypothetical protein